MDRRSHRRLVAFALLALGVLLAFVWLFARGRDERGASPTTVDAPADPTAVAATLEPLVSSTERAAAESIAPSTIAAEAAEPVASPITTPIEVLVVDAPTQIPVAGAEVRWANSDETGPEVDVTRPRQMIDAESLLANAHRTTTDAQGRATIDASVFPGRVLARVEGSFGTIAVDTNTARPLLIWMRPDVAFTLRVVDGEGEPVAGVPVGLRDSPHATVRGCFWRGTTGEQGVARVTHSRTFAKTVKQAYACIDTLAPSAQAVAVDLTAPPAEAVDLVLPACGSLSVRIHDARGTPVVPRSMKLALASDVDPKRASIVATAPVFTPETLVDGVATYPFVEIGLDIVFEVVASDRTPEVVGRGPQRKGERVEVDLDVGDPLIVLVGRLVDERGEAIANRAIESSFAGESDSSRASTGERLRTDGAGRFEYVLWLGSPSNLRATLALRPLGAGGGAGACAYVTLDDRLLSGRNDLGDVVAIAPRLLASGRVVDDRGERVGNAVLQAQSGEGSAWSTDVGLHVTCDDAGAFEARGVTRAPRLRIHASLGEHVPAPWIDVPVGSSGIEIVLERGASLVGQCLLDDPKLFKRVGVRLRGADDDPQWHFVGNDGKFVFRQVRGGVYQLEVRDHETKAILATIDGVRLSPGERATDGRVETIDLRGKLATSAPK